MAIKTVEMDLELQPYMLHEPMPPQQLWNQAVSADGPTMNHWTDIWLANIKENKKKYKSFAEYSIGKLFNREKYKPCVLAGAGPSIKNVWEALKEKKDIPLISCLHNFHFFEDRDIKVDYYVSLDAGPVTIEEVSEGGKHQPEWYWKRTKGKILLAFIGSHPELLKRWQGEIYFFNCPIPDPKYMQGVDEIELFNVFVSTGGNVLGACLNIAKAWLGCQTVGFIGADFSFSYTNKFHGWSSKYDKDLGHYVHWVDIYGNRVKTWQSYLNFKYWFDYIAITVGGVYFNCSEGGIMGAYRDGNIIQIKQINLKHYLNLWHMNENIRAQAENPQIKERHILF